ncbi:MAG: FmdB family zinc ribbon protein [Acidimicrobiales bacterium]|jgi:putative FmdB family regulatory protein
MPTYDYRCSTCGIDFDVFQSFSEDTLKKCPTQKSGNSPEGCTSSGRGKVEKVFSAPGIAFKGTGFYKNDSRSGATKSDKSTSSESSKSESTKSESSKGDSAKKSDSKSETKPKSDSTGKSDSSKKSPPAKSATKS